MAAFFVGKTGAVAEYVMIYEYRYFVYLDNSQKYLDFLAEKALYPCRFRLVGKGLERETLCPLPRLRRFGTHIETGSKFLLLFISRKCSLLKGGINNEEKIIIYH